MVVMMPLMVALPNIISSSYYHTIPILELTTERNVLMSFASLPAAASHYPCKVDASFVSFSVSLLVLKSVYGLELHSKLFLVASNFVPGSNILASFFAHNFPASHLLLAVLTKATLLFLLLLLLSPWQRFMV